MQYLPLNVGYFFTRRKTAIYIGATGQGNLGDEVIFEAIKDFFKETVYLYPISYAKPNSGSFLRKFIKRKPELIILGGGTIIKKKSNESYLALLLKFKNQFPNAKLIVMGAGVADPVLAKEIGFPTDIKAWSKILNDCYFIGVRGLFSCKVLKDDWKIVPQVHVLGDPVLHFAQKKLKPKVKKKRIAVNFCNILNRIYGKDQKSVEYFANELIRALITDNWIIYLYPTAKDDIEYMESILSQEIFDKINIYSNSGDFSGSLNFLESIDILVGQRLHSLILASLVYTPFFPIEYEAKTTDFLTSINYNKNVMRTDTLDYRHALSEINEMYRNLEKERGVLFDKILIAKNRQVETVNMLMNDLISKEQG